GLEVTLACHYRVGDKGARFGLPEVKLGLLPGAGGTQRLPRVVGVEKALQMIVSGDPIRADEALRYGLIDEVAEGELAAAAVTFAERGVSEQRPLRKIRDLDAKLAAARHTPELFANFRKSVARQTRGFRAPESCIKAIEAALSLPFDEGMKRERELFLELLASPESKAQRYFFYAEREAANIPDVPADTPVRDVNEIASATGRPESVIGTHFFSPANVMKLLENVRGAKSSKTTIATAMALGRRINKVPVLVGVCYGFVGNRMLHQRGKQ